MMFVGLQRSVKRRMRDGPQTFQKSSHVTRFGCIRHIRVTVSLDNALHHNKEHSLGKVLLFHSAPSCSILTSLQDQFNCKQLNKACYKMYSSRSVSNGDSPCTKKPLCYLVDMNMDINFRSFCIHLKIPAKI